MGEKRHDQVELGRLIRIKRKATLSTFIYFFAPGLLLFSIAVYSFSLGYFIFLAIIGAILLLRFFFDWLNKIECYEGGIIISKVGRSKLVPYSDIVAVRHVSIKDYINSIYTGTHIYLEIVAMSIEKAIHFKIHGFEGDSRDIRDIIQLIQNMNPKAQLLPYDQGLTCRPMGHSHRSPDSVFFIVAFSDQIFRG